ncbi:heme peroxidase [Rhodococcus sp. D2-41]|uniref:Heme peroxidase n=1 Tax=Speluncibacter jeojiensis TaxID=2710754 RepID=A0A9X4LZN7_9ACTN|nr:heme peroxidase [Rhodococcus sp. D2-41]MDG3012553.1 heme peroxidase [Rhodococcus sp. D2-41]MDG3015330.1 heme peroxidase [Corynebacteriales bacterium D3-21]
MSTSANELDTMIASCRDRLGDPAEWTDPDEYRHDLALCIIDAVQSAAARYDRVVQVVDRYRAYRRARGADTDPTDGARALLHSFEEVGGSMAWAGKIGCYKRRYCDDEEPPRAQSIEDAADRLYRLRIDSAEDLRAAAGRPALLAELERAWLSVSDDMDEANWQYFLSLAGVPGRQQHGSDSRFVATALGRDQAPTALTRELIHAAADHLQLSAADLDHAIWRWECNSTDRVPLPESTGDRRPLRVVA